MEKIRDGDTPEFQAKKRAYFRRLAIKWHADILGEKVCILVAGVVVGLLFSGEDDFTKALIVILTAIIYSVDFFADTCVVWVLDRYFGIPLLSAVPLDIEVRKIFKESITLACCVNGLVACIWMVVNMNKMF